MSETPVPYDAVGEQPTYMAHADRERSLRRAELRSELIPASQRLAETTEAAIAQSDLLLSHFGDPAISNETMLQAARCLAARLAERQAAKGEVERIERALGR